MKKFIKITVSIFLFSTIVILAIQNSEVIFSSTDLFFPENIADISETFEAEKVELKSKGIMRASWYGPGFHGKLTASGEIYDQYALTAAHKDLPFGTILEITNSRNNKSVLVRINDRGPYIQGRHIDLSKGAAIALGMVERGVIKVKVKEIVFDASASSLVQMD